MTWILSRPRAFVSGGIQDTAEPRARATIFMLRQPVLPIRDKAPYLVHGVGLKEFIELHDASGDVVASDEWGFVDV